MEQPEIEFFYDIASPYSYLAATQMDGLAERTGAIIHWRPFLLGAVMKATKNAPPITVPKKGQWMLSDLTLWATLYDIPFRLPSTFPPNSLLAMRAITAAPESATVPMSLALFDALYGHDLDISKPEVIARVASAVGFDGEALVEAATEQENKDALRAVTDDAIQRGAFGAPTFYVGERMFWGNDRIPLIDAVLAE